MKIAFFLDTASQHLGGAAGLLIQQAVLMSELHSVTMVLPCDAEGNYNLEFEIRCERYGLDYVTMSFSTAWSIHDIDVLHAESCIVELEKFIIQNRYDFLHSVQINVAVEYIARKHGIPHLMNIYQTAGVEIPYIDIFPRYICCDSEYYCNAWRDYLHAEARCIRPYTEVRVKAKREAVGEKTVLCSVGTICAYKNQMTTIEAVKRLISEGYNVTLLLAGYDSSGYAQECKQYVVENQLEANVFFVGFTSNIAEVLEQTDAIVCASKWESFPSSIVEAVTNEVAVISTPVGGVSEVFKNRDNAFIADGDDKDAIYRAILDYIEYMRSGKIAEIKKNAQGVYWKSFSKDTVRNQLNDYYREIKEDCTKHSYASIAWNEMLANVKIIAEKINKDVEAEEDRKRALSRAFFYSMIDERLKRVKGCYIWGAGKLGRFAKVVINALWRHVEVIAFIDQSKEGTIDNIPIVRREQLALQVDEVIFVAFAQGKDEVVGELVGQGLRLKEHIFTLH